MYLQYFDTVGIIGLLCWRGRKTLLNPIQLYRPTPMPAGFVIWFILHYLMITVAPFMQTTDESVPLAYCCIVELRTTHVTLLISRPRPLDQPASPYD